MSEPYHSVTIFWPSPGLPHSGPRGRSHVEPPWLGSGGAPDWLNGLSWAMQLSTSPLGRPRHWGKIPYLGLIPLKRECSIQTNNPQEWLISYMSLTALSLAAFPELGFPGQSCSHLPVQNQNKISNGIIFLNSFLRYFLLIQVFPVLKFTTHGMNGAH